MHEANFTEQIVYAIIEELKKYPDRKPRRVCVKVGEMLHLNEESVRMHYELLIKGTALEEAEIELKDDPVEVYCWQCNRRGPVTDHHLLTCGYCNATDVEVMKGNDIVIESIEIEQ
jgi:hydrogenase nickel incorporation protein HypA/HybF